MIAFSRAVESKLYPKSGQKNLSLRMIGQQANELIDNFLSLLIFPVYDSLKDPSKGNSGDDCEILEDNLYCFAYLFMLIKQMQPLWEVVDYPKVIYTVIFFFKFCILCFVLFVLFCFVCLVLFCLSCFVLFCLFFFFFFFTFFPFQGVNVELALDRYTEQGRELFRCFKKTFGSINATPWFYIFSYDGPHFATELYEVFSPDTAINFPFY